MTRRHNLSIVAIFRNEHKYLVEWLEYHIKVGVDHFYLYDNGGDHRDLLEPYMDHITYTLWTDDIAEKHIGETDHSRQTMAYMECVNVYGQQTDWLQLIDLDEYLVPMDNNDIRVSLKKYEKEKLGKLRIPRFNFGNNGHWKLPLSSSIDSYKRRERKSSHYKDMGKPEAIKRVNGPHSFRAKGNMEIPDNLRIYHHYTRSLNEWMKRAKTGGGQAGKGFRVLLGKNKILAYMTFLFLNIKSSHVMITLLSFNIILAVLNAHDYLYLLNLPLIGLEIFSFTKGQNEVKDKRLMELMG
ncbi:MAG: glycosyltransferase family 92 protein [Cytophagales bacterium]|nr:glycosyltransferase family 92 protein [Cytophagales bacterium]